MKEGAPIGRGNESISKKGEPQGKENKSDVRTINSPVVEELEMGDFRVQDWKQLDQVFNRVPFQETGPEILERISDDDASAVAGLLRQYLDGAFDAHELDRRIRGYIDEGGEVSGRKAA